jgi:hypothetical protein
MQDGRTQATLRLKIVKMIFYDCYYYYYTTKKKRCSEQGLYRMCRRRGRKKMTVRRSFYYFHTLSLSLVFFSYQKISTTRRRPVVT